MKVPSDGWKASALGNSSVDSETICSDHYDANNCVLYVFSERKSGQLDFFKLSKTAAESVKPMAMEKSTVVYMNGVNIQVDDFKHFSFKSDHTAQDFSFSLDYLFYKSY